MFNCLELWLSIADLSYNPGREGGARDLPAPHFSPIYKISRRIEVVLSKNLCRSRQPNRFVEKVFWWKILVISQDVLAPSRRPWEKLFPLKRKRASGLRLHYLRTLAVTFNRCLLGDVIALIALKH